MVALVAHFNGIGQGVEDTQGLLVGAAGVVGVAAAPDGKVVHAWHVHDFRRGLGEIKFLVLFFEVEGHGGPS